MQNLQQQSPADKITERRMLFTLSWANALAYLCFIIFTDYLSSGSSYDIGKGLVLFYFFGAFILLAILQLVILFLKPVKHNLLYGLGVVIGNAAVFYLIIYYHFQSLK